MFLATEGEKLSDFVKNREIVGYPNPEDVDKPIEEEYKEEDNVSQLKFPI